MAKALCWLLLHVLLAFPALAQEHVRSAQWRIEPGASWNAPAAVPAALADGAGWLDAALPHRRPRSLAADSSTVEAPPEVAWYRLAVPSGATYLYLPRWQTIGTVAVYADGRLVYRTGGSHVWNSFNRPLWVPLVESAEAARGAPPAAVFIRMASQQGVGGAISTAWLGTEESLLWRYRVRLWLQSDLVGLTAASFVVIGLFSLAVWCVRRRESLYALFFATSVVNALRALHYTMGDLPPVLPDAWFGWFTVNSLGWSMVCVFLFSFRVHGHPMPRLARAIVAVVAALSLLTLPVPLLLPHLDAILPLVYVVITSLTAVVALSGLWASWRRGSREGLVLSAWFALTVPVGVHDLLMMDYRAPMEGVYLAPYVAIGLFAIFLAIVYRRYVGAIRQVESANAQLEVRLAARERALAASYEQLQVLERQRTLDAERQRMMQEMHDGIGSSLLTALRLAERGRLQEADMARVLKECIDDLKLSIDSLEHSGTDLLGVLAALRFRLAPRLQAAGLQLHWRVVDVPPLEWLDPQSALHILRILQEVLTNIVKHSGARNIEIATGSDAGAVLVSVRDDGVPHDGRVPPQSGGKGMANVRSRATALGAGCEWRHEGAQAEWGNVFELRLPMAQHQDP